MLIAAPGAPGIQAIIEFDEQGPSRWLPGHFALVTSGELIGNRDDWVSRDVVRSGLAQFVGSHGLRWDDRLVGLEPDEVYRLLVESGYGDGPTVYIEDAIPTYHVTYIGATAFDRATVMLADPGFSEQWLMWGSGGTAAQPERVQTVRLGATELKELAPALIACIDLHERSVAGRDGGVGR